MTRIKLLAITLALVTVMPLVAGAQSAGCASIAVTAPGVEQPKGAKLPSFSATKIVNLDLATLFKPGSVNRFATGDHVAEFRVFTPTGALYQSISVPFTSSSARKGQPQKLDGYPRPVPIELLGETVTSTGKHAKVSARLAVAGSPVTLNSMYGEWRVESIIDGEDLPCATPAVFRIEP